MPSSHQTASRPGLEQESLFLQPPGYARLAYNWAVPESQAGLEVGKWVG